MRIGSTLRWPAALGVLLPVAATAQDIRLTPLADARLRWEDDRQDGIAAKADAVTARVRAGLAVADGPWSALAETEATLAIVERYNSGTNGLTRYPLVADPQNVELNRAQIGYAAHGIDATVGRQLIELADQRFVGSSSWRQNEQTFDAARVRLGDPGRLFADVTYAWSDRTVNGVDGFGARPTAIGGANVFALAGAHLPIGTISGFAYLIDQADVAVQRFALSNQTYGVRLDGHRALGRVGLVYRGTWARQSDYARNPNRYAATYWLAEGKAAIGILAATLGNEVLGADDGRALTSVQTPLASFFRFDGWANKFGTTPPDGLRDLYATGALVWKKAGPARDATLSATWHRFDADRLDRRYGREWDLLASARYGRTTLAARYARYRADTFATDTDKAFLTADWAL